MAQLSGPVRPVEDLAALVGDARFVLLGEATHGTHEFYAVRAELTRRLIAEHGFRGLAVEADWPAAARVDRFLRGGGEDGSTVEALGDFLRFPDWLWRNHVVVELIDWLRERRIGFYGLDLHSLCDSMHAVIEYLDDVDPPAADRARRRYACFEGFDERGYGRAAASGEKDPCADAVAAQLCELLAPAARAEPLGAAARFAAEQNAKLAADAEAYFRAMYRAGPAAWNLRDTHMADTLDALHLHLGRAKLVVWAHNSHVGDARATEMGARQGELSLGQLVRQRHGDAALLVGFTTHAGSVTAAADWGGPAERCLLRPSLDRSLERLLHDAGVRRGVLDLRTGALPDEQVIERMIGAVYRPEAELWNHYANAWPVRQFDLLVHLDETTALAPLDRIAAVEDPASTYRTGS